MLPGVPDPLSESDVCDEPFHIHTLSGAAVVRTNPHDCREPGELAGE